MKLFSTLEIPEALHSDQEQNFESTILKDTLEAFRVRKSCTTAYHPQGDSMVERLNRSHAELQDLIETNLAEAAAHQKTIYDKHSTHRYFDVGDMVWLSVPTAGKLDPRWEGNWKISAVKSPVTMEITDGRRKKVVHVNRLHHRVQPGCDKGEKVSADPQTLWTPPHYVVPEPAPVPPLRRNPSRNRRPPDYFEPT